MILDRLSAREKKIFYVVIALGVLMVGYHGVWQPVMSRMGELDKEIFSLQMKLRKARIFMRQREEILTESKKYPNLKQIEAGSDEEELARLLNFIEMTARQARVGLSDVKPQPLKSDKVSKRYVVELNAESGFSEVLEFVYELQRSPQLIRVDKLEMSPKEPKKPALRSYVIVTRVVVK